MDKHTQKFKVRLGLFIAGGLLLFVITIFYIGKQQNLFNPVFKITTSFYNVSGLQVGNNIRFSGINVGTVDNIIIINDSTVKVDMLIRKNVQQFIKSDSEAGIGSEGIIGDRVLIITQGSNEAPIVKDGQRIISTEPVETDAIMASFQVTAGSVQIITKQLEEIMIKINSGRGTLGRIIHDSIIAQNIKQTIESLKKSSQGIDATINATKHNIDDIMTSLQGTAGNAENSMREFENIMLKVNSGQGTLGRFIQDTIIAENLSQTIVNLKNSSKGLDENMEALKHNFLFRGYFKKKAKAEEQTKSDEEQKAIDIKQE